MNQAKQLRKLRPWFLIAAMCATWIVGVFGTTNGCSNLAFLRGSEPLPQMLRPGAEDEASHPIIRLSIIRERARFEALSKHHGVAFPLSVAQLLLGALLVLASGAALTGRPNARHLALQAIAANAILAAIDYGLSEPIRDAMVKALATDEIQHAASAMGNFHPGDTLQMREAVHLWVERMRFLLLELGVYGSALAALTRPRTKAFFRAVAQRNAPSKNDPSGPD